MGSAVQDVVAAFCARHQRLAVFDREIRELTGEWELATPVPVADVLHRFRDHPGLHARDGTVVVPLHEADGPAPTGEYLVLSTRGGDPTVTFHDFGRGGPVSVPVERLAGTYPATRLRLWADALAGDHDLATDDLTAAPAVAGAAGEPGDGDRPAGGTAATPAASPSSTAPSSDAASSAPTTSGGTSAAPPQSGTTSGAAASDTPTATPRSGAGAGGDADADLFEQVRSFLARIRDEEKGSARGQLADCPPSALPERHPGIPACTVADRRVGRDGRQVITVGVTDEGADTESIPDTYGVYPGSVVLVAAHGDVAGLPVEATVTSVTDGRLDVVVDWDTAAAKGPAEAALAPDANTRVCLAHLLNPVPYDRQAQAVETVAAAQRKRAVLVGDRRPAFASVRDGRLVTAGLNADQERAVDRAHRARDVLCIHGPPGTGKTRTLTRIVTNECGEHAQVLACAHSNQAVDNLIVGSSTPDRPDPRSLHAAARGGDLTIARVGDHSSNPVVLEHYAGADYHHADVVATTTSGAHRFREDQFDLAVVDEASQATIPSTLIPYAKASRLVLAGDHRQLPPYHSSERDEHEDMAVSLFEHLLAVHGDACRTTLSTQYRMHEAIAAFPNREFYDGRLTHGDRNRTWTAGEFAPLAGVDVAGTERQSPGHSYYNEREAKAVVREVSRLLHGGVPAHKIGIITPYSAQIAKIRGRVAEVLVGESADAVAVDTVDSFQGGQRDAIVVSFVRSNPAGRTGFLTFPGEGPRRLNVALTRAKKRLVLVGDWDTLGTVGPGKSPATSCAPLYARLAEHLRSAGAMREWPVEAPDPR